MADRTFLVSLSVKDAAELIKKTTTAERVFESQSESGDIEQCMLSYQKYFFRNSSYAALIVVIDNILGKTKVTVVVTGGSASLFGSWDWGAANDWLEEFADSFTNYMIKE
ncbi:MAG: hypothetical protein K0Q56_1290 [Sporolactobacillus laevolacticus]|nr:hypothetical protein [Sporolactobacillus laevolacticus]